MDLALIGNGSYQALIDSRGRVQWLCWPRFDSSFVLGALLDDEKGGEFSIEPVGEGYQVRQRYLEDTAILKTTYTSKEHEFNIIDFAPRSLSGERPRQLIRRIKVKKGTPKIRVRAKTVYDYGRGESDRVHLQCSMPFEGGEAVFELKESLYLALSWDEPVHGSLRRSCELLLVETRQSWQAWVASLRLPPTGYIDEVIRSAITLKLHHYEDTGAITAAATTSIPEHAGSGRTWDYRYCWPRDAFFSVDALHLLGRKQESESFADFLWSVSQGGPWQPLYGIGGERDIEESILEHLKGYRGDGPVRIGNLAYTQEQHDIYGEMIAALAPVYQAKPDERRRDLLLSLLDAIDRNFERPDAGIWEKRMEPEVYTFSMLMHWVGGRCVHNLGMEFIDTELAERGEAIMDRARDYIDTHCWDEDRGYFVDVAGGTHADAALLFMISAGYLNFKDARAKTHLKGMVERLEAHDGFIHRYLHDDGLGETHSTFTVCTLWYAEALAWLGEFDEAERVLKTVLARANHLGLLSEDIDPSDMSLWGNFPQTYSHVGIIRCALVLAHRPHS